MLAQSVGYDPRAIIGAGPTHGPSMAFYLVWGEGFGNDLDGSEGDSYDQDECP